MLATIASRIIHQLIHIETIIANPFKTYLVLHPTIFDKPQTPW
jgi:hypothetical protein